MEVLEEADWNWFRRQRCLKLKQRKGGVWRRYGKGEGERGRREKRGKGERENERKRRQREGPWAINGRPSYPGTLDTFIFRTTFPDRLASGPGSRASWLTR